MGTWRRPKLVPGIYDEIVSERLDAQLQQLGPELQIVRKELGKGESVSSQLATWLRGAIDVALTELDGKPEESLALAQDLLATLQRHFDQKFAADDELRLRRERLRAIIARPSQEPARPKGSLHTSGLIANGEDDSLLDHLRSEFESADRVLLLCAFVKLSGFEKLRSAIEQHCVSRGRPMRVLTTTYMGASDAKAIERLALLSNVEVRVAYDEDVTRLHAKAWIFQRDSGVSTAYVGSSNLSHAAQTEGLEWNVRLTESDQAALVAQMEETFEQYWADGDQFEPFDPRNPAQKTRLARALSQERRRDDTSDFLAELEPKDFQKPVLAELEAARALDRHRNLLVAATGTGKTVMAALDYRALRERGAVDSLLFVAHRREILEQARRVYRSALQLRDFGELLFEGECPSVGRHVFASIDSLGEDGLLDPARFDMVVLDEAHHTAAKKWQDLLACVRPKELLGLTGTPERADGIDYEASFPRPWIGNLRLWNAIPHALVPFRYYALDVEGVDLRDVAWTMGRYAPEALAGKLVGAAEIFVQRAVRAIAEQIARPSELRAIAFCVDLRHAEEVCRRFQQHDYRARVLQHATRADERRDARRALNAGEVQILCVVDLYNEGVDVPNVNTIFFFRPTESATVFLQQLGRGLRRAPVKAELVVFDLTGRQHLKFRFDRRLRAMLGHTPRELRELVQTGFGRLPPGCHLQFDEVAREDVLRQIRSAIPDDLKGLRALLGEPAHAELSLAEFLHETDVDLESIYRKDWSWTLLRRSVRLDDRPLAEGEQEALERVHKLIHVGDAKRLELWQALIDGRRPSTEAERRLAHMLFAVLYDKKIATRDEAWRLWEAQACVREELAALIPVLRQRNALLAEPHELDPDIPLALHGRYLGVELSAAFNHLTAEGAVRDYYTGVEKTGGGRYDLLLVTMEKSAATKEHLRYRDFPLNEHRFHWQSKARTRQDDAQGRRHLQPKAEGCTPLLFVRERADDRPGVTMAFRYLGPVEPDGASGERPITVEWKLRFAMPGEVLRVGRVAA